jgi:hypothetical protein
MTRTLSDEDLGELERLLEQATPGPWRSFVEGRDHTSGSHFIQTEGKDIELVGATIADQDLIVAARNALLPLIDEVRRFRAAGA